MSMGNAARFGLRNSYPFNLGILVGFSIVMSMCAVFSSTLFIYIPKVKIYMLFVGAAYMLYLALKILKSSYEIEPRRSGKIGFKFGVLFQFINPKLYIYAITIMSVYLIPAFDSNLALIGFSFLLAFIGFTSTIVWALFGEVFHKLLQKHLRIVNLIMSLLLVYCAISLFL
jgi:threonine/homoserine/homoserine lactone efflux protein